MSDAVWIAIIVAISTIINGYFVAKSKQVSKDNGIKLDSIHILVNGRLEATLEELKSVTVKLADEKKKNEGDK